MTYRFARLPPALAFGHGTSEFDIRRYPGVLR